MRGSYDGTLATRKILDEDTNMDMSKPNTTIQSETEIDDEVESKISKRLEIILRIIIKKILITIIMN